MKISNILFIALIVFIFSGLLYEKTLLKKEYHKINYCSVNGDHYNVIPFYDFDHVVIKGGNYDGRVELRETLKEELKFNDYMKHNFTYKYSNDTLYITMNKNTTKPYYRWSANKILVNYINIKSLSFENSQNSISGSSLSKLTINAKGTNSCYFHIRKIDSLKINATGNTELWSGGPRKINYFPRKINYLEVKATGNANLNLRMQTNSKNVKKSGNAKVKIW